MKKTDNLVQVIDKALEAPLPDGDITTAEEIAQAIRTYISGCLPQEREVIERLYGNVQNIENIGFNACLKSVREALRLGEI